jgi:acyl-CoA reductase-like NAD-dependent aldehyde dehydrogenase
MEDWVCPMLVAPKSSGTLELLHAEPLGVVANISAWNFPYFVGSNVWVPGLLAGNAVLYKPSEWTLQTGRRVSELMLEAGVPEGVFAPIYGGAEAGAALVAQPLDGVFFTGSCATGRKIASAVYSEAALAHRMATRPKSVFPRLQLELGGKDPVYVADDVVDAVAVGEGVADGAFFNAGQSCCAVERIYAHEKVPCGTARLLGHHSYLKYGSCPCVLREFTSKRSTLKPF